MAAIIENQHISKRRKPSSFKTIYKSAGTNAEFMNQFRQKPARSKKKSPVSIFMSFEMFSKKAAKRPEPHPSYRRREERSPKSVRESGFSFSVPFLPTLAVVAGTVVIALAALNWEDININIKIPDNYVYRPASIEAESSQVAQQLIMQYAATGVTNFIPAQGVLTQDVLTRNEGAQAKTPVAAAIASAEEAPSTNNHDDLISFEWQQYRVKRGDSVSVIAQQFGVSVGAIIASNEIRNARRLQEGALLKIPNIDGIPYQVKNGDSLLKIAAAFNVPLEVILDVNDIKSDNIRSGETIFIPGARMNDIDLRLSLGELFMYPIQGRYITSNYGMRKDPINGKLAFHTGIDLRANTGTTVMAALDGVVSVVAENWLYGNYIIITHDNGYKTLYGHLNSFSVKQGDRVTRGKKIGETGNTGYSTGPHLHFTIYDKNNKLVNPLELLK
ncbi:MAG: M23 family metallopeptidase [Treponema sp.]|jgi:murein DD-endopeptidase MepM/ murein hydrolase activator NlpD|nr:M23 family metallopeptidase [Treponema sp.]